MVAILSMPFVDRKQVVIGGQSRGGILSAAYAGQHPGQVKGVMNFVGGWMGARCINASTIN
jgi:dienelactone hydrolase